MRSPALARHALDLALTRRLLLTPAIIALGSACSGGSQTTATSETGGTTTSGGESESEGATTTAGETDTDALPEPDPVVAWPTLECDPLDPNYCLFPFPNNVYTAPDPSTPTGLHLALSPVALPISADGVMSDPAILADKDGFSAGLAGMVHMPGATITGLPSPLTIELSMTPESPTIVLDAETGERLPHFTELDMSHADPARRTLLIRPVVRPRDGARYIFAIRGVVDESGAPLPASPAFAALRDLQPFDGDPSIDARRPLYADLFKRLGDAGVARAELQLAWDFTTASRDNNTARMLHIRDHALAQVGDAGPPYTITKITEDCHEQIALCVYGEMTVPLYLDQADAGGRMILGDDGLPQQNGTADYPFTVLIPKSAFDAPSTPTAYGHGLLGSQGQVENGTFRQWAEDHHHILFAVDWIGMAEDDLLNILNILDGGKLEDFTSVSDRGQQGILNFILATRMMRGAFAEDPQLSYQSKPALFDTSAAYYFGNSQGGIFGGTLMAVQVDVTRGMLGVPGQPYNLLLNRSVDFEGYFEILRLTYPDPIDIQAALALIQILWDRAAPTGYTPYIRDPLPNTPAHEVLLNIAIGDHQVSTLGAHIMARTIGGVVNLGPVNRSIYGIPEVTGPHEGSAMVEFDFGLPPEPTFNVPMKQGDDPHGGPRKTVAANKSLDRFFRDGIAETFCDGPCDPE
ncbi:MAG: hypothetical protein R3B09_27785 [Nannocystaceae bacterium]